ncbi:uncharacterized protein MONOS_11026 [Monocercomonoides exilis]|uniref:uncharacterized protein n=1 Tax=Monocercomonoides exilis TaxID=2049356 RepID=UPI003559BCDD|nr:hypothetical protein MONOS_11026 [Monocercomonoides exilis]|eukprot:MONOS_11026.1-p1 / transcript=MONOS_11026.1 / gene=MONOS_11026 / organism=Monocercomonoides_exilis_PA203 / gene_product=unspecified product / transcript_product=unspecified product / location=Mono_scaffold00529:28313-28729(-) / protein_length=139 / sequence_SO=supercontig / SO=protein_coding / is_pseudo=false
MMQLANLLKILPAHLALLCECVNGASYIVTDEMVVDHILAQEFIEAFERERNQKEMEEVDSVKDSYDASSSCSSSSSLSSSSLSLSISSSASSSSFASSSIIHKQYTHQQAKEWTSFFSLLSLADIGMADATALAGDI